MSSASSLIGAILDAAARAGVDVDSLLAAAGLDRARLDDPTAELDLESYDRLRLLALEWTEDPAFGLQVGELLEHEHRGFGFEPCEAIQARMEPSLRSVAEQPTFTERVHALVCAQSLGTRPSAAEVAHALHLTERSLRRRLEAEATSFTAVMDVARSEVARRVLAEASITIKEAGFRMGFSDVSAFHRAFKRWTGMTPAEYQRGLAEVRALDEGVASSSSSETFPEPISEIRALRPVPAIEHG